MTILSNKSKPPPPPPQQQQSTVPNSSSASVVVGSVSQQAPTISVTSVNTNSPGISINSTSNNANAVNDSNILVQVGESLNAVTNVLVDSIGVGKTSVSHVDKSAESSSDSGSGVKAKTLQGKNAATSDNESKTVNIQISDIQNANEAVNNLMPLSSSSSNSSPISTSLLLQTETGRIESSSLLSNSTNINNNKSSINNKTPSMTTISSNSSSTNISKNKNHTNSSGKLKANKKRKISGTSSSSIQLIPASSQQTYSFDPLSSVALARSLNSSRIIEKSQIKVPKLTINSILQPVDLHQHQRQNRTLSTSTNTVSFERITTQVLPNNILNLNPVSVAGVSHSNTSDNENNNNNDSDSDFDFLNKTDNQISDDDDDSDLNTQFKQNLINQQILQQQQLYLQQQQQQQHQQQHENKLKNSTQNPRKKLTKKKSSKSKMSLLGSRTNTIGIKENMLKENENQFNNPINSEDEYENSRPFMSQKQRGLFKNSNTNLVQNMVTTAETIEELEAKFERAMKEKKGFIIKPMKEDGACLFRAVADQIYGDEEMHSTIRVHCMDYIAKNADYFKQYMTEDVDRYLSRKRQDTCHGNHIEIIAIAEIYNRPIEVYEYSIDPKNTFQSGFETDNEPIRLSYHGRNHYNSVVNPYKATIGVGLGLPQMTPGLAEKNLMNEALKKSEEFHLEKTMMDDKMKASDWEATNEEIMELIARESYLQWLKDNEKRNQLPGIATCSTWENQSLEAAQSSNSSNKQQQGTSPHHPSQSKLTHLKTSPKPSTSKTQPCQSVVKTTAPTTSTQAASLLNLSTSNNSTEYTEPDTAYHNQYYDSMNDLPVDLYGLGNNDWLGLDDNQHEGDDILARVLAASQQEYLESLKAKRHSNQQN